jgi:hypothetical protein
VPAAVKSRRSVSDFHWMKYVPLGPGLSLLHLLHKLWHVVRRFLTLWGMNLDPRNHLPHHSSHLCVNATNYVGEKFQNKLQIVVSSAGKWSEPVYHPPPPITTSPNYYFKPEHFQ